MPLTRALIFANGEQFDQVVVRSMIQPGDFLVAVDGGLHQLVGLGLQPDLLIGDLDSAAPEDIDRVARMNCQVMRFPVDKDETDLELAVLAALQLGYRDLLILGALGGRLDMSLANICLLMLPELVGCNIRLEDGKEEVFIIRPARGAAILGKTGDRVSLLPWGGPAAGIKTEGLFYPLRNETLFPERTRGISNRMTADQASVFLESGLLVCIHTRAAFAQ